MNPIAVLVTHIERRQPNLAILVLVANLLGFAVSMLVSEWLPDGNGQGLSLDPGLASLMFCGAEAVGQIAVGEWFRLVTVMFLHGDLLHLAFNSFATFSLMPHAQVALGTTRTITLYLLGGLAASVASLGWKLTRLSDLDLDTLLTGVAPSVGASGAVFAVFGLLIGLVWTRRDPVGTAVRNQLVFWLLINVAYGLTSPAIDNAAHFGGFAFGFAFARIEERARLEKLRRALGSRTLAGILLLVVLAAVIHLGVWMAGKPGREFRELLAIQDVFLESQVLPRADFQGREAERDARDLLEQLDDVEGGASGEVLRSYLRLPLDRFPSPAARQRAIRERTQAWADLLPRMRLRLGVIAPVYRNR